MAVRLVVVGSLLMMLTSGCGKKDGNVTGTVTYKGKSLTHGTVVFHGVDGIPVNGIIDEAGKYEAKGIPPGETLVTVIQLPKDYRSPADLRKEFEAAGKTLNFAQLSPPKSLIPERYNNPEQSGLKANVVRGAMSFDIQLVD